MISAFTIVTKNYIPLADILSASIRRVNPEINFFCFVVDEPVRELEARVIEGTLLFVSQLNLIDDYEDLAFKYDLTEFCTAVKPFCFEHLFKQDYEKVIYFDPDIFVFSSLNHIIEKLNEYSFFLTPHLVEAEKIYTGIFQEGNFLKSGIFNLGFLALSKQDPTFIFLEWWKQRLISKGYADTIEGYFTDQKWIDFIPAIFSNYYVERSPGYNIALWNIHERIVDFSEEKRVKLRNDMKSEWETIVFIHYSNFKFNRYKITAEFYPVELHKCADFNPAVDFYIDKLSKSNFLAFFEKYPYDYGKFENGKDVLKLHRRLYRRFSDSGNKLIKPFSVAEGSFYSTLMDQKLIVQNAGVAKADSKDDKLLESRIEIIQKFFFFIHKIVGTSRYALFCRLALRFFRPENQYFLLGKPVSKGIRFLNDTSYLKENG